MTKVENIRAEVARLIHSAPFHRFVLNLENGDRVLIEHPENIAFNPEARTKDGSFYVITGKVKLFGSFESVTSIVLTDRNGAARE
jgi:hypothetical protein